MTVPEVARLLRVSQDHVRRNLIATGRLGHFRAGKRRLIRIPANAVREFIAIETRKDTATARKSNSRERVLV